jgi:phenylpyruvate tautomerase PptA (4-oxalocrotonate tautomerase family)
MADKARRVRGKSITVPDTWLEQVRHYKTRTKRTLRAIAKDVSQILGRQVAHTTVHDYLIGRVVTQELTEAFAELLGVPTPVLSVEHVEDVEVAEWCALGYRFKRLHEGQFRRELAELRDVVTTLERYAGRRESPR